MDTQRLFLAVPLPPPVRESLAAVGPTLAAFSPTPVEQLHLTLRFLGDVAVEAVTPLIERLSAVRVAPFILPMEGVGSFPPRRPPRVLWVGVGSGHPRLFQLRQRLDDALLASGLDLDVRLFQPHVTLARVPESASAAAQHWLQSHREFSAPPFQVDAFELYASELRPEGALHTLKARFPLAK